MTPSRLEQTLAEIKPDERRVLERVAEPSPEKNRWYRIAQNFEVSPPGLFHWINRPSREYMPRAHHHYCDAQSVRAIPKPVVTFSGRADQLLDHYGINDSFFLSERLLEVFCKLDPSAIEWVEVDMEGTSVPYFYCLHSRSLPAVDEDRTTIVVTKTLVSFQDDLFAVSQDVAPEVHCFALLHRAYPLWSRELVDAVKESGAKGIEFWPPFCKRWDKHSIRI